MKPQWVIQNAPGVVPGRKGSSVLRTLLLVLCTITATPALPQEPQPIALVTALENIGDQAMEFWVHRAEDAHTTLIFENGLMLPLSTWEKVIDRLPGGANMLLYNRPGVGRSAFPEMPQDAAHSTRQVQELARQQGLRPPYILVGHSIGGQYAQLFARHYPDQVSGMVLVDALPPGALKPSADFPWYTCLGLWLIAPAYVRREIHNAHAMGEALLAQPSKSRMPVIRLLADTDPTATKPEGLIKDLLKGVVYAEDFGVWAKDPDVAERDLDAIYPQSIVRRVRANHRLPEVDPVLVAEAIREVIRLATAVDQHSTPENTEQKALPTNQP